MPCEMSRVIAQANPEMIERHTFPDAGHGLSYLVDTEQYTGLVMSPRGFAYLLGAEPESVNRFRGNPGEGIRKALFLYLQST